MHDSERKSNPDRVASVSGTPGETGTQGLAYEAPGIEQVLSPEDLEREVLYAGTQSFPVCS
jgi:hypothetical protein